MSKRLYPKPARGREPKENLANRPYHVQYSDPDNETAATEWRHYNSELAVKLGAWYNCRFLGFNKEATLFTREELKPLLPPQAPQELE